ncbi:MAG: hypothetical protein ACTS73_06800 [Arsenophonus sp. NEOnobi-MAG3]
MFISRPPIYRPVRKDDRLCLLLFLSASVSMHVSKELVSVEDVY